MTLPEPIDTMIPRYHSADGQVFTIAEPERREPQLRDCQERELMHVILDAHEMHVRRRRETGQRHPAEVILWKAIQRYAGDIGDLERQLGRS